MRGRLSPRRGRRLHAAVLTALVLSVAVTVGGTSPAMAARAPRATHIVQLARTLPTSAGERLVRRVGGRTTARLHIIHAIAARLSPHAAARLRTFRGIRAVTRNAAVRSQRLLDTSQLVSTYPYAAQAPQTWTTLRGRGVGVAVVDTGIDGNLPDFRATDGSSRVVGSVVTNPGATTAQDTYGHGTHVAGILAGDGTQRTLGDPEWGRYIGVAPGANLVSVKISDDHGAATVLDAIYGLQFIVDHKSDYNIRIANLSFEAADPSSYHTDPLDAAAEAAYFNGILVVAAAGNHGTSADAVSRPPANDPFVLSVGAFDPIETRPVSDDIYTSWSSVGTTQDGIAKPEVGAPGVHMASLLAPNSDYGLLCPACIVDGQYFLAGGTSMAAPVVSGVAALMLEAHPGWTPDQLKSSIIATARRSSSSAPPEVNAAGATTLLTPASGANAGFTPNDLVDPATGTIDPTRSSWTRSSWTSATDTLGATWARSSWTCACGTTGGTVDSTRSSWTAASWSTFWGGGG